MKRYEEIFEEVCNATTRAYTSNEEMAARIIAAALIYTVNSIKNGHYGEDD